MEKPSGSGLEVGRCQEPLETVLVTQSPPGGHILRRMSCLILLLCASSTHGAIIKQSFTFGILDQDVDVSIPVVDVIMEYRFEPFDESLGILDLVTLSVTSTYISSWELAYLLPGDSGPVDLPDIHFISLDLLGGVNIAHGIVSCSGEERCSATSVVSGEFNRSVEIAPEDWLPRVSLSALLAEDNLGCRRPDGSLVGERPLEDCIAIHGGVRFPDGSFATDWEGVVTATYHYTPVVEPKEITLLVTGALLMLGLRRRRKTQMRSPAS